MSFDFRNYGHGPCALYDVEAIGYEIVERRLVKVTDWKDEPTGAASVSIRECPKCGTRCTRKYEQFNIHFDCTCYRFDNACRLADIGLFLVGFFWLGDRHIRSDFRRAASVEEFLEALIG
jgi:hypothetical protein